MKQQSVFGTPNKGYLGLYQAPNAGLRVVITLAGKTLVLEVYGHRAIRFQITPHAIRTSGWPANMFELANCDSMTRDLPFDGHHFCQHSSIHFTRNDGGIVSFTWAAYKGQPVAVFTKSTSQQSPLLLLPSEIRCSIARYVVRGESGKIIVSKSGTSFGAFHTYHKPEDAFTRFNELSRTCMLLRHEFQGMEFMDNKVTTTEASFLHLLKVSTGPAKHAIRNISVCSPIDVLSHGNVHLRLRPFFKFCMEHPKALLSLKLDCWHCFGARHVFGLIRTGWILERAFRGTFHKNLLVEDVAIVTALKRTVAPANLNVENLRLFPLAKPCYSTKAAKDRYIASVLEKKPDKMIKSIVANYGTLERVFEAMDNWKCIGV
ncbi:hypothetical protein NX059_003589 [Plenodomus lindquistii]|nr:hypothetical protein NX059_003589 [Plenodomus lindquistii]